MTFNELKQNIQRMKEIIREIYVFTNQILIIENLEKNQTTLINSREKKLLYDTVSALTTQLDILNKSIPTLTEGIGFFQKLSTTSEKRIEVSAENPLIKINYTPEETKPPVSLSIGQEDRQLFLENLSKSNLSINQLKKNFGIEKPSPEFGKPNTYAIWSNRYFRKTSNKLLLSGKLDRLNADLRSMNSPFVVGTYTSMILFTMVLMTIFSFFLFIVLLFFNIGFVFPFISPAQDSIFIRIVKFFGIIILIPALTGALMYFYPRSESKNIGAKIDQELPFVAIHMSAIATSGVEPVNIFKVIIKNEEYHYSRLEFRKLLNLINFHGADLVSALKKVSASSPSNKLKELLDGMATTITSGGDLHGFLEKHAETLLFDYRIEREKYTKTAETFMDIYISIVIAAPMILLMLFVIMGSTNMNFMGIPTELMGILIIFVIVVLNIGFLLFLRLKQPTF
ncbi:MAG: type II secretion system F family protein [Candidatus Pacearchaeota archaeon]|jgi:Flp pilus assembly protein TadB